MDSYAASWTPGDRKLPMQFARVEPHSLSQSTLKAPEERAGVIDGKVTLGRREARTQVDAQGSRDGWI